MKGVQVAELVSGVPELRGAEPLRVLRDGRLLGLFYPLAACRYLSVERRRELWQAVAAVEGRTEGATGLTDEEIVGRLEAAGREPAP